MLRGLRYGGIVLAVIGLVLAATFSQVSTASAVSAQTQLPGGRGYYVVTVAHLDTKTPTSNWVKLAFYRFDAKGNAYQGWWYWRSTGKYGLTKAMTACPYACDFYTVPQYITQGPAQLHGTFQTLATRLSITWDNGVKEAWNVNTTRVAALAELTIDATNTSYAPTHGHGFGSTSDWTTGADAAAIYSAYRANEVNDVWALPGESHGWIWQGPGHYNQISDSTSRVGFIPTTTSCSHQCLTVDSDSATAYYGTPSTTLPRKMMREVFKNSHKVNNCYQSSKPNVVHPHLIPALEVIDDSGKFRGWVAVEVSLWEQPEKYTDYMSVSWYSTTS